MPRLRIPYFAAVALLFLVTACSQKEGAPASGPAAAGAGRGAARGGGAPVPAHTAVAVKKAVAVTIPAVGTAEAISTVQIRSQVTGQLTTVHFAEGQDVRKGDPLFTLDSRAYRAALEQAMATLARDSATLRNLESQRARVETLFQRGLISREQLESSRASTAAVAATVEADNAAIETARVNMLYTEIVSPISGRTGALGVHAGDLIRANDSTAMVTINQVAPIYVTFAVPGRLLSDIRRFHAMRPLTVSAAIADPAGTTSTVPAGDGETGTLTFIDNAVDTTTGTIRLKATFPNGTHQLWPGAFLRVTLNLHTETDVTVVPAVAVQDSQDGPYVYTVKPDRTVELRRVKVARQQGDDVVISDGISAGDTVVTDGHLRLVPGARIADPGQGAAGAGAPRHQ